MILFREIKYARLIGPACPLAGSALLAPWRALVALALRTAGPAACGLLRSGDSTRPGAVSAAAAMMLMPGVGMGAGGFHWWPDSAGHGRCALILRRCLGSGRLQDVLVPREIGGTTSVPTALVFEQRAAGRSAVLPVVAALNAILYCRWSQRR